MPVTSTWTVPLQVTLSLGSASPELRERSGRGVTAEGLFGGSDSDEIPFEEASRRFNAASFSESAFGWQTALNTALCSALAYRDGGAVQQTAKNQWGLETAVPFAEADTEGFVASNSDAVVVAFRGTQQVRDWLANLNVGYTQFPLGTVHRGFFFALQAVRSQVEEAIRDAGGANKKVYFTGHSLGGALATLAAAEWHGDFEIAGVYTFGQPAVGLSNFRSAMAVRYPDSFHRFVNEDDIVPRVPPFYRHVGKLYHFTGDDTLRHESLAPQAIGDDTPTMSPAQFEELQARCRAAKAATPLIESARGDLFLEGWLPSIRDHNMERYLTKILGRLA
ncbi:lipase family protein [Stratiformator vulcanicus]|uniref:Lipase (Class 3) n=1 Tax=Stratiformator vulcanicus TaxID=2527980 RepID=A0A517QWK0_9PLAN|nr:lipase family protein [Stratiformator vulcanicus]QDT35967.1 Lipase (class 3) [Stratiformator vulcanicus]